MALTRKEKYPYSVTLRAGLDSVEVSRHGTKERGLKALERAHKKAASRQVKGYALLWHDTPHADLEIIEKREVV